MAIGKLAKVKPTVEVAKPVEDVSTLRVGDIVRLVKDWAAPRSRSGYYDSTMQSFPVGTIGMVYSASYPGGRNLYLQIQDGQHVNFIPAPKIELLLPPYEEVVVSALGKFGGSPGHGSTGSDPEVFVLDANGVVIPAWEFLPPKEKAGLRMLSDDIPDRSFYDGFQGEFTTIAGSCHDGQIGNIRRGLFAILERAKKHNPKATLTHGCVVEVPFEMMQAASDEHAALGCAPSLNIYPDEAPLVIPQPKQLAIRFAGCHMHFGDIMNQPAIERCVKAMDKIAAVAMVSLLEGLEDERRRHFYGRAGEYRVPVHGLEWRVPSSAVLCHPVVTYLCFDLARWVKQLGLTFGAERWKSSEEETREIVNACDVKGARRVLRRNKEMLAEIASGIYTSNEGNSIQLAQDLILQGAKEHLPIGDMVANWNLETIKMVKSLRLRAWQSRKIQEEAAIAISAQREQLPRYALLVPSGISF